MGVGLVRCLGTQVCVSKHGLAFLVSSAKEDKSSRLLGCSAVSLTAASTEGCERLDRDTSSTGASQGVREETRSQKCAR